MKRLYRLNSLELEQQLKTLGYKDNYIKKHIWKYDVFLTLLINKKRFTNKRYNKLSHARLENQLGRIKINGKVDRAYSIIRRDLEKLGVIKYHTTGTSDWKNQKFRKEVYYKINKEWTKLGWKQVKYDISDWIVSKMESTEMYTGMYVEMQKNLGLVTIDYDSALAFCDQALLDRKELRLKKKGFVWKKRNMNIKTYSSWMMILDMIRDGEYNFYVDQKSTNRIYHFVTSLPKELRQFIYINGKSIIELDIKNCQPVLFNKSIEEYLILNNINHTTDTLKFKELTEAGEFYNYIINLIPDAKEETFKVDFFGKIFFSSEKKNYKWRQIFREHFPTVDIIITYYKKNCYKDLAIKLQRDESDIMINRVCRQLINSGIEEFFTIHDAIYCTIDCIDEAYNIILEQFKTINLNPTIKTKQLN